MIESDPALFDSAGLVRHPLALGEGLSLATLSRVPQASFHRVSKGLRTTPRSKRPRLGNALPDGNPGASLHRGHPAQLLGIESP
jgi:hypothetical protein